MSVFARLALAAFFAILCLPANAVQPTGSAAWANGGWTNVETELYSGPGTQYDSAGTVPGGEHVRVMQCRYTWCEIRAAEAHGWTNIAHISFGTSPWRFPDTAVRSPVRIGGPVCFYSGYSYSGSEVCFNGGHVSRDLRLAGLDNSFRSVKVGNGSALVCRDRNFRSYCVVVNKDTTHLEGLLDGAITSIHVY